MKLRIFKKLNDGVFTVRIHTEDWSESDRSLMERYGEPEIDLGGTFSSDDSSDSSSSSVQITLPTSYTRVMTESPFLQKFDSRDLQGTAHAKEIATSWSSAIESRIAMKIAELRSKSDMFSTEEISEY